MKFKDIFLLSWKKLWIAVVTGFISILLHNAIYGIFGVEEAFFFIIVVFVIPIWFIISIIFTSVSYLRNKKGGKK